MRPSAGTQGRAVDLSSHVDRLAAVRASVAAVAPDHGTKAESGTPGSPGNARFESGEP